MAEFDRAFNKTIIIEGGYSFDPVDAGGETWHGISRRFHPNWPGWVIIDKEKTKKLDFLEVLLESNDELTELEKQFYRDQFWNRFMGDSIPSQAIANELFDTAVNMGVHRAVMFLQSALNLLNRNQANYTDIIEDGVCGTVTIQRLEQCLSVEGDIPALLKLMNVLQGMHYIEYARKDPKQERFLRGWLKRV